MRITLDATTVKIGIFCATIAAFFWLTGCAATPTQTITVEKPVIVPGPTTYIPIPAGMFDGCKPPAPAGPTNGDLMLHDHAESDYATCLLAHLTAIKGLH